MSPALNADPRQDPVIYTDGITYDRASIERLLKLGGKVLDSKADPDAATTRNPVLTEFLKQRIKRLARHHVQEMADFCREVLSAMPVEKGGPALEVDQAAVAKLEVYRVRCAAKAEREAAFAHDVAAQAEHDRTTTEPRPKPEIPEI